MMGLSIDTRGVTTLAYEPKALRSLMRKVGGEIVSQARANLRGAGGGGRTYFNSGGNQYKPYVTGRHTASAPGSAPARQTGFLAKALKSAVWKSGQGVTVKDTAFWSSALEYGASGGGRKGGIYLRRKAAAATGRVLQARPFLGPALTAKSGSLISRIRDAVEQDITFKKQSAIR